jgi:hypothetical protein
MLERPHQMAAGQVLEGTVELEPGSDPGGEGGGGRTPIESIHTRSRTLELERRLIVCYRTVVWTPHG